LETWLQGKGIKIDPAFITDIQCGSVAVSRGGGNNFFRMQQQIKFHYLPIISNFADHPLSKGLEQVELQFASPISFSGDASTTKFTPFARTSKKSGTANTPLTFDIEKRWTERDFPLSELVVGGIIEGNFVNDSPAKIVVISDGDFANNGPQQQQRRVSEDNVNLMVNSIDWLSDDTGLIELRTKGVSSRPIAQLEDSQRSMYKYVNFLLPILLVIGYGLFRSQRRRSRRMKHMQESYE